MIILNRIKEMKNDISCRFFALYTGQILIATKVESLHGTTWTYDCDI